MTVTLSAAPLSRVRTFLFGRTVNAIGPFELTEYLGLAMVWGALAVTAPFRVAARPVAATR